MHKKVCSRCKLEKPFSDFSAKNNSKNGIRPRCKKCDSEVHAIKNPARTFDDVAPLCELFIWANAMEEERFVPVKDFESRYWISDFGRIISCDIRCGTVNFLRPHIDITNYYSVLLRKKPHKRNVRIHTLVGEHFIEKSDSSHMVINHITGCQLFNYYKDLEWGDHANNSKHAVETGLFNIKGERHPHSKLTEADVKKIRKHRVEGLTYSEIGRLFGISRRQAADVAKGVNWGWLKD